MTDPVIYVTLGISLMIAAFLIPAAVMSLGTYGIAKIIHLGVRTFGSQVTATFTRVENCAVIYRAYIFAFVDKHGQQQEMSVFGEYRFLGKPKATIADVKIGEQTQLYYKDASFLARAMFTSSALNRTLLNSTLRTTVLLVAILYSIVVVSTLFGTMDRYDISFVDTMYLVGQHITHGINDQRYFDQILLDFADYKCQANPEHQFCGADPAL